MNDQVPEIQAMDLQIRVLFPFYFPRHCVDPAAVALTKLKYQNEQVWHNASPPKFYRSEVLENVQDFLFDDKGSGCRYLRVAPEVLATRFPETLQVHYPEGGNFNIHLPAEPGIELFMSFHGVGILSIGLTVSQVLSQRDIKARGNSLDLQVIQRLSFQLAQPETELASWFGDTEGESISRYTAVQSDGVCTLAAVKDFLLTPLQEAGFEHEPVQQLFSVYTTVRFADEAVDFQASATRTVLGQLLSGLAQVEDVDDASTPMDDLSVPHVLLNSRHWAAVSYLGAAHLVADQPNKSNAESNGFHLTTVRDKYFIAYLLALMQRYTLHRTMTAAGEVVRSGDTGSGGTARLASLRNTLLSFAVDGYFTEVSSRDVINRYYELARRGLRVADAWEQVHRAIADIDNERDELRRSQIVVQLRDNVARVTEVQNKIEWLEVFFVSFYAVELVHVLGHQVFHFNSSYMVSSILGWGFGALGVALVGLRPWDHAIVERTKGQRLRQIGVTFTALIGAFTLWLAVGQLWFSEDYEPTEPGAIILRPAEQRLAVELAEIQNLNFSEHPAIQRHLATAENHQRFAAEHKAHGHFEAARLAYEDAIAELTRAETLDEAAAFSAAQRQLFHEALEKHGKDVPQAELERLNQQAQQRFEAGKFQEAADLWRQVLETLQGIK